MNGFLHLACDLALAMLLLAVVVALIRLARGPHLADRAAAFELIALAAVGGVVIEAIRSGEILLLRPALVVALVGFLGTVAIADYLERRRR